jgi:3-deoxy-D-manno-octulosonic-acid transferase
VKAALPNALSIIVPRHPQRGDDAAGVLTAAGLVVARRSRGELPTPATEVYLADTLGELGLFYRLAPVAFIGNSLVGGGGHNPAEAVELGAAVLTGPHVDNFTDVFARLGRAAPATLVPGPEQLAGAVVNLLNARGTASRQAQAQAAALAGLKGAVDATVAALRPFLSGRMRA